MASPRHDPTRSLLEPKKTYQYLGIIAQDPRFVRGWDNSSARFERAKMFYEEHKDHLPKDIAFTEICTWVQALKINERAYAPINFVLKGLNGKYQIEDLLKLEQDGSHNESEEDRKDLS